MTPQALAAAWRPKILGTWLLHEHLKGEPLDFFVLFSSVASVLGTFGQGNYAAGNSFLDAVAHDRRAAGLPALSVNWGPWAEVGMAARTDPASMQGQAGIQTLSPDEGLECLARAMGGEQAQLMAARVDWELWVRSTPGGAAGYLAARLVEKAEGPEGPDSGAQVPRGTFAEEILALADPEQRRARVLERLLEVCAAVARLEPAQLDPRLPLPALGFDSILTAEVRGQVRKHFGVEIPLARMLLGANIARVAELVLAALAVAEGGGAPGVAAAEPLSALATATPVA
jgi:hypothetical protein